ncbi:acyl-CoA dehydrogenase family protein [Bradyrhizobium sp. Ce-3]|uniref:acyl-CoA dehydrogenase family protein n=1 Tax=Bradyrhizobium sp. Ce-3 TaxID=2913970 RepID=UPI001FC80959|nr:acyl-CoA dehydrogenase family protein [Bradyrhizobium sp. Ce-3]GKQ55169.1 acyl-CoA dehydrogenase [Bradyrhizobium sp. Ce-3]
MIDLASHEMTMLRQTVRGFVRDRLEPLEQQIETDDNVSPDLLAKLRSEAAGLGIYGFNLPAELGGYGLPVAAQVGILEEVTHTSVPLSEVVGFLPLSLIHLNEEQRGRILPDLVSGRVTMTYALTEPDAGSDLGAIRTKAVKVEGGWRLEGAKQFISNVETCDYVIVLAVSDPSASLKGRLTTFIVKRTNPGLAGMTRYRKMGWRGYHLNGFSLEDCFVPDADVLGRPGDGFLVMMASINHDRILSACRSLGLAQRAHDMSVAYAKERRAFGSQLAGHQAIQFMIADNDVEIEATRALIYRAAALCDQEDPSSRIAVSRAKLYASEMGCRVVDRCLQIFGGMGYMCELPIERFYRDARAFRLGEGTSEMQRIQIARQALSN